MTGSRKWLFVLAVVALLAGFTVPVSAQIPTTPICSSQVATNYLARAEGYTEQVGDLIVTCTGGTPTAAGFPVPEADITVTMSQNVTSRITAASSSGTFLDALLIIDEPNSPSTGHPNVFQGRLGQTANTVVFHEVPLDPPGSSTRILRFTNIRVNASGAGITEANQSALITMSITSAGSSVFQIEVPAQAVATVQRGLQSSIIYSNSGFAECVSQRKGSLTGTSEPAFGLRGCGSAGCDPEGNSFVGSGYGTPTVRFSELFASAWKVKDVAYTAGGAGGGNVYIYPAASPDNPAGMPRPAANQDVPGVSYFTESGFEFQPAPQNPATNAPLGNANPFSDAMTGVNVGGTANAGTRLAVSLQNIPNGLSVYVSPVLFLYRQGVSYSAGPDQNSPAGAATGVMVLTNTASDGSGSYYPPSAPITGASQPLQLVSVSNGAALVVYEILFTDPLSLEYADVPILFYGSAQQTVGRQDNSAVRIVIETGFYPFTRFSPVRLPLGLKSQRQVSSATREDAVGVRGPGRRAATRLTDVGPLSAGSQLGGQNSLVSPQPSLPIFSFPLPLRI